MRETRTAVSSKQLTSEKGEIILTIGRPIKNISIGPNVRLYLFWSFFTVFFFFVLVFYNDWKETKLGSSLTAITTVFVDCRKNEIFFLKNLLTSERQKERGEREKKKGLIVYAHYCAVQAAKPSPHLGRRGLAAIGNIIIISIVGDEVCVDMMIHPDRIEMSTGGLGQEGGEAKLKKELFFFEGVVRFIGWCYMFGVDLSL